MYPEQCVCCVLSSAVRPGHQFISHELGVIYRLKIGGCGQAGAQCAPDNAVMRAGAIQGSRHGPGHCLITTLDSREGGGIQS